MQVKLIDKNNKGIFSTKSYMIGQLIYTFNPQYVKQPTRTSIQHEDKHFEDEIGRYLNHNCLPNTDIVSDGRGIHLVCLDIIKMNENLKGYDKDLNIKSTTAKKQIRKVLEKCAGK